MDNLQLVGEKIKKIRKSKKISQEKLAEMISMNHRSIVRIENHHTLPTIETLNKIASALDVNIIDFFEHKSFKNKDEILKNINKITSKMSFKELEKFYKVICNFYE